MTGQADPREKARAVLLAALMVLSVFAGTVAMAGTAAAATTGNMSLDDATVLEGDTVNGTVELDGNNNDTDLHVWIDENDDGVYNTSEPSVTVSNTAFDSTTTADVAFSGLDTTGLDAGTYDVAAAQNASLNAGLAEGATASLDVRAITLSGLESPRVSVHNETITVSVTLSNVAPNDVTETVEYVASTGGNPLSTVTSKDVTVTAGSDETVTFSVNTADLPDSDSNGINHYEHGIRVNPTLTANLTVGTSTEGAIEAEVTNLDNEPIEGANVTLYVVNQNGNLEEVASGVADGGPENNFIRFGGLAIGNDTQSIEYVIDANKENFFADSRSAELDTNNVEATLSPSLERKVNADRMSVTPGDQTVDLADSVDYTALVETEDFDPVGEFDPIDDSDVEVTVESVSDPDNTFGTGDVTVSAPNPASTDANGEATFTIDLDESVAPNYDKVVDVTIEFTALDTGNGDITVTRNVTFEGEPPTGEGTIAGDVDEVSEDIQLGADSQNAQAAEGVHVHAVQVQRASPNGLAVYDNDGAGSWSTDYADDTVNRALEADGIQYFRVVNNETGNVLDVRTDYLVKTGSATTTPGPVEIAHNASIPGTGFNVENSSTTGYFVVTALEPGEYKLQTSANGSFQAPTDVYTFTADNDITFDAIQDRYSEVSAQHTDVTGADGEFFLTNLYTDGTNGLDYYVIAGDGNPKLGFANGFGYDKVTVQQNAELDDRQMDMALAVQPFDITIFPDTVNVTQVGTHPPLDETGGAPDVDQIDPFDDPSDDTYQRVARDGTVDVIRVDTSSSEFPNTEVSGTVTVELADDFDGQFLDTVLDGQLNADSNLLVNNDQPNATITVNTDENGTAYVLLQTEQNSTTLDTQKIASIDNDLYQDSDESNVTFVGTTTFESAGVSGISRDSDDTLIPNAVVWAEEFTWGGTNGPKITVDPVTDASPGTSDYAEAFDEGTDEFTVTLWEHNGSAYAEVASDTVTRNDLRAYEFDAFPSITSERAFRLVDVVEDPESASYTLEPIPAESTGVTNYELRGVKLDQPEIGVRSLTGSFDVEVGEGGTQNVIFPIDIATANLLVDAISDQTIETGENVTVDVTVENTGGNQGASQTLELTVDGQVVASQDVTVDAGETQVFTLEGDTSDFAAGEYEMIASTADSQSTATLTIEEPQEPANFQITSLSPQDATVTQGDEMTVEIEVTNTGDVAGTQDVLLGIGEDLSQTQEVTDLAAGASTTVTFTVDTSNLSTDTYSLDVFTEDDAATTNVTIEAATNWWDEYTNENGVVDDDGINTAVVDYLAEDLSDDRFNTLVNSYLTGTPVPELIEA